MPDLRFLLFMLAVLLPAAVMLLWLDQSGILNSAHSKFSGWIEARYNAFSERVRIKRFKSGKGPWIAAPVGSADRGALLLHDIELATNRPLLVTFDKVVYVTPRHRKEIARYLQRSHFERGVAAEVFARHGYQLVTERH